MYIFFLSDPYTLPSQCEASTEIRFLWSFMSASNNALPSLSAPNNRRLFIPPGTLAIGEEFELQLAVYMAIRPTLLSFSILKILTDRLDLIVKVVGGNRGIAWLGEVYLRSSVSG